MPKPPRKGAVVPALEKAIWVIRYLNASAPLGVTLAELSVRGEISRSHCHGIMQTLLAHDWVSYDPAQRTYKLKAQLADDTASLLNAALPMDEVRATLMPFARRLSVLCVISRIEPDSSFLVVDTVDGGNNVSISVPIGYRYLPDAPCQCKAAHAWAPEEETEAWLESWEPRPYTRSSKRTRAEMRAAFEETRRRGYAISLGEYTDGIVSIGLPIFDSRGRIILIVQMPGVRDRVEQRVEELAAALTAAVAEIHRRIGGRPPPGVGVARAPSTAHGIPA
ncbi:MAG TPA: IclR family transcriptional regulator C-terminal domain-containing protein [Bauldia sp.]|nr:IclR family transcriptional regulator C-terminal domain-containing protein [Bauldia sp.]